MKVTGQVEVDVFHRENLGMTPTGCTAFDAEHRTHGGFSNHAGGGLADMAQGLREANRGDRFSFTERCGVDGGHQNEAALRLGKALFERGPGDFGHSVAHGHQFVCRDAELPRNRFYGFHVGGACDFKVGGHCFGAAQWVFETVARSRRAKAGFATICEAWASLVLHRAQVVWEVNTSHLGHIMDRRQALDEG